MRKKKAKKDYGFKTIPNLEYTIPFHGCIFALTIVPFYFLSFDNSYHLIWIILAIVFPVILVSSLIYSTFFGWNAVIYFTKDKIYQNHNGKIQEWYYKDIIKVKGWTHRFILFNNPPYPPKVRIKSSVNPKTLSFRLDKDIRKGIPEICTDEKFKARIKEILDACDFPYI